MASNFPGEFEVRINYTIILGGKTTNHQQRFSFDANTVGNVGDDFDQWTPIQRSGSEALDLAASIQVYTDELQDYYHSTCTINDAELWKYATGTFDAAWQASEAITKVGSGTNVNGQDAEQIMTFRTTLGGLMRAHFMQGPETAGLKQTLPLANVDLDTLADEILKSGNWFKGRDGGYPIVLLGMYPGQNEALFKARFR